MPASAGLLVSEGRIATTSSTGNQVHDFTSVFVRVPLLRILISRLKNLFGIGVGQSAGVANVTYQCNNNIDVTPVRCAVESGPVILH